MLVRKIEEAVNKEIPRLSSQLEQRATHQYVKEEIAKTQLEGTVDVSALAFKSDINSKIGVKAINIGVNHIVENWELNALSASSGLETTNGEYIRTDDYLFFSNEVVFYKKSSSILRFFEYEQDGTFIKVLYYGSGIENKEITLDISKKYRITYTESFVLGDIKDISNNIIIFDKSQKIESIDYLNNYIEEIDNRPVSPNMTSDDFLTKENSETTIDLEINDGNIKSNGNTESNSTYNHLKVDVRPNEVYKVGGRVYKSEQNYIVLVVFKDEKNNVISYEVGTDSTSAIIVKDYTVTVPQKATIMYINSFNNKSALSCKKVEKLLKVDEKDLTSNLKLKINRINEEIKAKPVLVQTDFNSDIDDAVALSILSWGEKKGLIDILGVVMNHKCTQTSDKTYYGIEAMDTIFNFNGISDMVYAVNNDKTSTSKFYKSLCDNYYYRNLANNVMDDITFQRKALVSLQDGDKCDIVSVGFLNNLSRLMNSTGDEISELNGIELIKDKVDTIWIMGGRYDIQATSYETNLAGDFDATINVLENCPVKIVFLGQEFWDVTSGQRIVDENKTYHILYQGLKAYWETREGSGVIKGRSSWDPMTVLMACVGTDKCGLGLVQGTNTVVKDSADTYYKCNRFTENNVGNHYYVKKRYSKEYYQDMLENIIDDVSVEYENKVKRRNLINW